jgi:hypothetical protein
MEVQAPNSKWTYVHVHTNGRIRQNLVSIWIAKGRATGRHQHLKDFEDILAFNNAKDVCICINKKQEIQNTFCLLILLIQILFLHTPFREAIKTRFGQSSLSINMPASGCQCERNFSTANGVSIGANCILPL